MTESAIYKLLNKTICYCFYTLFFLVPLILTPWNYELFEFNKMMLVYGLTSIIFSAWLGKMVMEKRFILKTTPLDIPIAIFLLSQVASFIFSIDPHVSLWGYYSRFHGGLLSTISYIILFYAFVSNFSTNLQGKSKNYLANLQLTKSLKAKDKGKKYQVENGELKVESLKLLLVALLAGFLVSLYGILQHFGIDAHLWVQDVQNRVFSTLGQPNWLAAYLAVLIPISLGIGFFFTLAGKKKALIAILILNLAFYLALLYTKSRSGFLGFWGANVLFWVFLFLFIRFIRRQPKKTKPAGHHGSHLRTAQPSFINTSFINTLIKSFFIFNILFLFLTFIIGSPFARLNKYFTLNGIIKMLTKETTKPQATTPAGTVLETGGTESGQIRRIVWKGAIEITKHYPLFGTGVETFAFAYYKFRPAEHNLTSEWDFLYNKAHNEYLNFAATTGLVGLTSYLLLIVVFIGWNFVKLNAKTYAWPVSQKESNTKKFNSSTSNLPFDILHLALLAGWLSILITNFFGFSVVIVALFFWLIPAMIFNLTAWRSKPPKSSQVVKLSASIWQKILLLIILLSELTLLFKLATLWKADALYARGNHMADADQYSESYKYLDKAIKLNPGEPVYRDAMSSTLATLALAAFSQNQATLAATLEQQAINQSDIALSISPQNVNFWKTRTRVFYTLAAIKNNYYQDALKAITVASQLAPTDAKIAYNLALIQAETGKKEEAIKTLKKAVSLKPNYREPHYALALFYQEDNKLEEAKAELKYILENINPDDKQAKDKLEELGI